MSLTLALAQITAPNWWHTHPATLVKPPACRLDAAYEKRRRQTANTA